MTCPHCQSELTAAEVAALLASLRKNPSGGQPVQQRCFCGLFSMRQVATRPAEIQERHTPTMCVRLPRGRPKLLKTD